MAYSVAGGGTQHAVSAPGATGTPTTSLTWPAAPTNGNLLLCFFTFRINATPTEATAQGWIRITGSVATNGANCQSEIWYRIAGVGEGTTGPSFNFGVGSLYHLAMAEITGFTGTPTLDRQGTATATGLAAVTVQTALATTAATELVFAGCGDSQGNTAGIAWSASTAGGGATLGADIDTINPTKNGEGIRDVWATSGASGTTPSITFNLSPATNVVLAAGIATFKDVAAAAPVAAVIRQGVRRARPRISPSRLVTPASAPPVVQQASPAPSIGRVWRARPRITPSRLLILAPAPPAPPPAATLATRGHVWPRLTLAPSRSVVPAPGVAVQPVPSTSPTRGHVWPARLPIKPSSQVIPAAFVSVAPPPPATFAVSGRRWVPRARGGLSRSVIPAAVPPAVVPGVPAVGPVSGVRR